MATKTIEVIISADSQKLISELKKGNTSLGDFGGNANSASKSTTAFSSELNGLARELGLTIALGATVSSLIDFGEQSFEAAAAAERLGRATNAMGSEFGTTGTAIVQSIQEASGFTISKMDAMAAANKAMLFGIIQDKGDFAELTKIAVTLGAAMGQSAQKSIDDLTIALGRNSPMILDNLGLSIKLTDAYNIYATSLGKTAEQLTETEKKEAFQQAALIAGREKVIQLGGVVEDTASKQERYTAAISDFQVAFGNLITGPGSAGIDWATNMTRVLEEGANAWNTNLGPMQVFFDTLSTGTTVSNLFNNAASAGQSALEGVVTWYAQGAAGLAELVFGQDAVVAAAQSAVAAYGNQSNAINSNTNTINTNKAANDELTNSLVNQEEQRTKLSSIDGSYFSTLKKYQEDATKSAEEYAAKVGELNTTTAEKRTKTETDTAEKIKQLNIDEAQKKADLIARGQAFSASTLQSLLDANTRYYDQKRAQVQKDSTDELATLDKTNAEKLAKLNEARAKEQEDQRKHLEQLKLQTALNVLETTGELEKLTGIAGLKAKDAYELVTAGVIQIDGKLGTALQTTISSFSQQQSNISAQARSNQQSLQSIYTGSFDTIAANNTTMTNTLISNTNRIKTAADEAASAFTRMQSAGLSAGQAASGARYTGLASYYGAYQTGGQFTVGGSGGRDSQMVNFRASPGEIVTVAPPGQGGNVNNSVANNQQSKTYNLYIQGGNSMNISSEFKLLEALG